MGIARSLTTNAACSCLVHLDLFDDKSALVEIEDERNQRSASAPLSKSQRRTLARALSPVYVVKSALKCYASYRAEDEDCFRFGLLSFRWSEKQTKAVRFTSKKAARAVAKAYPHADARVVRLK
jgi:hypothetical protein